MSANIVVSTDGSCLALNNSGQGAIGWGIAEHRADFTRSGGASVGTNQIAELSAVLVALRTYRPSSPKAAKSLVIQTDSQYAISCATEWLANWKRNGWRNSKKQRVANADLIAAIDFEMTMRKEAGGTIDFVWVKGHSGDTYNEKADQLAFAKSNEFQKLIGTERWNDFSEMPDEAHKYILERHKLEVGDEASGAGDGQLTLF